LRGQEGYECNRQDFQASSEKGKRIQARRSEGEALDSNLIAELGQVVGDQLASGGRLWSTCFAVGGEKRARDFR
jgi:hypothetical protein